MNLATIRLKSSIEGGRHQRSRSRKFTTMLSLHELAKPRKLCHKPEISLILVAI